MSANDRSTCNRSTTNSGSEIILGVGEDLKLTCLTDHNNNGAVELLTWYKDDTALDIETMTTDDDRYMIWATADDDSCIATDLSISDVQETDGGMYVCSGSNTNAATVSVTVCPVLPECSWRLTSENGTGLNDTIELACKTCQNTWVNASTYSLWWTKYQSIEEVGNSTSNLASAVIDIHSALASKFTCHFSAGLPSRYEASCEVELLTVFPEFQIVQEGENVSFTCHVNVTGYYVVWFENAANIRMSSSVVYSNYQQTGTITLSGVKASPSSSLRCLIFDVRGVQVQQKYVYFNVTSNEVTKAESTSRVSITTQERMASVYVEKTQMSDTKPSWSSNNIIIIVVATCGAFVFLVIIIGHIIYLCHRRNTAPEIDSPPALYSDTINPDPSAQQNHRYYENMSHESGGKHELTTGITNTGGGEITDEHNLERNTGKETSGIGNAARPRYEEIGPTYERVDDPIRTTPQSPHQDNSSPYKNWP